MIFGCKINDFQKVFPKRIRKTPQDKHKMLQDAPKTAQDAHKTSRDAPKTRPRRHKTAQEHPKTPPRGGPARARSWKKLGSKSDLQRTPFQISILERLGVDLGRFLDGFRELLKSIFTDFTGDRSRAQGSLNLSKLARCRPRRRASEPRSGVARCSRSRAKGSLNLPSHLIVRQSRTRQQRASKSNLFLR